MARLLVLGDLHLSTTGPEIPPAVPDLETLDVDAIVSVGDVIDDNRDHADDASTGDAYEERGRAFFERLNEVGVPVVAVPGNHDPLDCTRRLADGLENVVVAHRCGIDGGSLDGSLDELRLVGWGCERFDLTPAFEYDRYRSIVPELADVESVERTARRSARTVETAVGQFLAGETDASGATAELGIPEELREECVDELDALAAEFEAIRTLLAGGEGRTVLLSHESPFHVAFDHHHSEDGLEGRLHRGSIPLKMAIVAAAPDIVFSGHTHVRGRDVVETTEGYTEIFNPGSPGVEFVEIDVASGSLRIRG